MEHHIHCAQYSQRRIYDQRFRIRTKGMGVPVVLFTIGPYCTATPLSGPVGTKVTISGKGFRTGEDGVTFTWDGPIIDTNFTAQPNGTFSWPITVPPSVKGEHTIGIYGSSFTPKAHSAGYKV